jgi:hypothetical protein
MSLGYTVKDLGNGNISVTCDRSGLPFERATQMGMFCNDPNGCACEAESNKMGSSGSIEEQVEELAKMLGLEI